MKRLSALALTLVAATSAHGTPIMCSIDAKNDFHMCFPDAPMRVSSDGKTRQFPLFQGGPNKIRSTGHTGTVYCPANDMVPVLELRDKSGVVYARNQAVTRFGMQFTNDVCTFKKTRIDKKLDAKR